ncbi:unnamed protein product [Trichobilharzia regenti]|nr:unnamed protein product [Trichobilharzia regenti]
MSSLFCYYHHPTNLYQGVYGDVQRVKIIHNKRSTALVQMTDASQALRAAINHLSSSMYYFVFSLAVNFLNGVPLYGKTLRCILSKNTYINMPQNILYTPDGDESQNTCDYSGHKLHRFKHVNSRNHFNICAPSKVLHVTNLPDVVDEEKLKNVFEHICECRVSRVKTFK